MQVRNDGHHEGLFTVRQWAKKGYLPKHDAKGIELWANQNCKRSFTYYNVDEVEQASKEALDDYWKPERQRKAANRKSNAEAKRAAAEREKQETALYITALEKQIKELSETISRLIPLCATQGSYDPAVDIVIDIETTGLNPNEDEILQVSIINTSGETLYNSYIKPIFTSDWKDAQRVNHISPEMVADAPNIYDEIPKINSILRNAKTIIGYNHQYFDIPFLEHYGAIIPESAESYDVMLEFAPIYGEWSETREAYRWQKLTTCAAHYNYDWGKSTAHDSLADCKATLHCYNSLLAEIQTKE